MVFEIDRKAPEDLSKNVVIVLMSDGWVRVIEEKEEEKSVSGISFMAGGRW